MSVYVGSDIERDVAIDCDVCIVGSGAGGAHVAARLSAAGKRVVVLEEGGFHTSDTFDLTEANMNPRLYQERGWRSTADGSIGVLQGRAVGGTTVVNWTTCFRTPKRVIDAWTERHGVTGISYEALVPHFEQVEKRLNVHEVRLEDVNKNNLVIWRGAKKLGWNVELVKRNVKHCAQSGYCGVGCPIDAKQSMLVTMIPEAVRSGADVYANVWVERVERDGRRATKVVGRAFDPKSDKPSGHTLTVSAKIVVLAAGGINSPAILLRSGINASGRTGRRTFLHPAVVAAGVHDERIDGYTGAPQYVASQQFAQRGTDKMGFLIEATPVFPVMTAAANFEFGGAHQELMERLPYMSLSNAILHDGFESNDADEGGTVSLRKSGQPELVYRWSPRLMEGLCEATMRGAELQLAGGAKAVYSVHTRPIVVRSNADLKELARARYGANQVGVFSAHVMGGCAMGSNPAKSVIDSRSLRHHELDNLFVIDGSVYPTSLTVNPQLSIYGLSSWASEHVRALAA